MTKYTVVTASNGDTGIRVYMTKAADAQGAIDNAKLMDAEDYPENKSEFSAVEVFENSIPVYSV